MKIFNDNLPGFSTAYSQTAGNGGSIDLLNRKVGTVEQCCVGMQSWQTNTIGFFAGVTAVQCMSAKALSAITPTLLMKSLGVMSAYVPTILSVGTSYGMVLATSTLLVGTIARDMYTNFSGDSRELNQLMFDWYNKNKNDESTDYVHSYQSGQSVCLVNSFFKNSTANFKKITMPTLVTFAALGVTALLGKY